MKIADKCICCGSRDLKKSPAVLMPFIAHRVFDWKPVEVTAKWGLKTIPNGKLYSICNSVLCNDCGVLFSDIRFDNEEMNLLYNDYNGKEYTRIRQLYENYKEQNGNLDTGVNYVPDIEKFLIPYLDLPVNILDWGGNTGDNTPFKNRNKLFHIYDIGGKPVIEGAVKIDKKTAYNNRYDLIVCANVLEHIPYPEELILDMRILMRGNTILYIEVPCENEIDLSKKYWHEHINFFTEKSLRKLLTRYGLSIVKLEKMDGSAAPGSAAFLYRIVCMKGGE